MECLLGKTLNNVPSSCQAQYTCMHTYALLFNVAYSMQLYLPRKSAMASPTQTTNGFVWHNHCCQMRDATLHAHISVHNVGCSSIAQYTLCFMQVFIGCGYTTLPPRTG